MGQTYRGGSALPTPIKFEIMASERAVSGGDFGTRSKVGVSKFQTAVWLELALHCRHDLDSTTSSTRFRRAQMCWHLRNGDVKHLVQSLWTSSRQIAKCRMGPLSRLVGCLVYALGTMVPSYKSVNVEELVAAHQHHAQAAKLGRVGFSRPDSVATQRVKAFASRFR